MRTENMKNEVLMYDRKFNLAYLENMECVKCYIILNSRDFMKKL